MERVGYARIWGFSMYLTLAMILAIASVRCEWSRKEPTTVHFGGSKMLIQTLIKGLLGEYDCNLTHEVVRSVPAIEIHYMDFGPAGGKESYDWCV